MRCYFLSVVGKKKIIKVYKSFITSRVVTDIRVSTFSKGFCTAILRVDITTIVFILLLSLRKSNLNISYVCTKRTEDGIEINKKRKYVGLLFFSWLGGEKTIIRKLDKRTKKVYSGVYLL